MLGVTQRFEMVHHLRFFLLLLQAMLQVLPSSALSVEKSLFSEKVDEN